jgi:hypothetical protein
LYGRHVVHAQLGDERLASQQITQETTKPNTLTAAVAAAMYFDWQDDRETPFYFWHWKATGEFP